MSANKLASTMQISKEEAERLIKKYFTVFPSIGHKLKQLGLYGMSKGYIITLPPFKRRRWFVHGPSSEHLIIDHLNGSYNSDLGTIDRASKNAPIQGSGADITKLALVYIRRYIYTNKLTDKVKVVMQVHDQIDTVCHKDYAEIWRKQMTILMEDAAKVVIPSGLLTSETNISDKWEK